jgi:hypothetical protein
VGVEFGDYSGLTNVAGTAHPAWADASNSTSDNPNGTNNFDAYTDAFTTKLTPVSPCLRFTCVVAELKPDFVVLECALMPCIIRDPVDRNCTMKFNCPGCPPGALCQPWYTFLVGDMDPAWRVDLFDPRGQRVNYQTRKAGAGTLFSFQPEKQFFVNGKLGGYSFVFETTKRSLLHKQQSVAMGVSAGARPFGSEYGSSKMMKNKR